MKLLGVDSRVVCIHRSSNQDLPRLETPLLYALNLFQAKALHNTFKRERRGARFMPRSNEMFLKINGSIAPFPIFLPSNKLSAFSSLGESIIFNNILNAPFTYPHCLSKNSSRTNSVKES